MSQAAVWRTGELENKRGRSRATWQNQRNCVRQFVRKLRRHRVALFFILTGAKKSFGKYFPVWNLTLNFKERERVREKKRIVVEVRDRSWDHDLGGDRGKAKMVTNMEMERARNIEKQRNRYKKGDGYRGRSEHKPWYRDNRWRVVDGNWSLAVKWESHALVWSHLLNSRDCKFLLRLSRC